VLADGLYVVLHCFQPCSVTSDRISSRASRASVSTSRRWHSASARRARSDDVSRRVLCRCRLDADLLQSSMATRTTAFTTGC